MSGQPPDSHMYGFDHRNGDRSSLGSYNHNLLHFCSGSDDPWFPAGVIQPTETQNSSQSRPSIPAFDGVVYNFRGYRSAPLASDCETALGDSGYGSSRPTYSIIESVSSIHENDACADAEFLDATAEQLIGEMNLNVSAPIAKTPETVFSQASPLKFRCTRCNAMVKTKSELRKHSHRHDKPYKCTYKNCNKATTGFSTPNDLARHKRTVHREHQSGPIFYCPIGPCASKKKPWPRADNFRNHLARAHNVHLKADSDLALYRHKPNVAESHEPMDGKSSVDSRPQPMPPPNTLLYVCRHDPCPHPKGKVWPIADEFSAHLAESHDIHTGNDLKYYHYQSEIEELNALRGVGSSVADVDPEPRPAQLHDSPDLRGDQAPTTAANQVQDESSKQSSLPPALTCLASGYESQSTSPNVLEGLDLTSVADAQPLAGDGDDLESVDDVSPQESDPIVPRDEPELEAFDQDEGNLLGGDEEMPDHEEPSMPHVASPDVVVQSTTDAPQAGIPEADKMAEEPSDAASGAQMEVSATSPPHDSRNAAELFTLLKDVPLDTALKEGMSEVLFSFLRHLPKDVLEKALNRDDRAGSENDIANDATDVQKTPSKCPKCSKSFSRMCELRKHMKRHNKPYGCTYKTCDKSFGSKNDWKRHESSQHFQLESWNCDVEDCNNVFPRRELFRRHLVHHHKAQEAEVENKLESCRLGRHCDRHFWCGFCDKFVKITDEVVVNSWTKRCDHIDSHLFGKDGMVKKTMSDWHYLEDKLKEGEEPSGKKRRATDDLEERAPKRFNYIWKCCQCNHTESYRTSSSCMMNNCNHQRCDNCLNEKVLEVDHEFDAINQEGENVN